MSLTTERQAPRRRLVIAFLPILVAMLLAGAGCGSDDDGGGGGASGDDSSSAKLDEAQQLVDKAYKRPTQITQTKPIDKPIPTGKKVSWISCGIEVCVFQGKLVQEGAGILGWDAKVVATDGSPEKIQNAMLSAIRDGTDALMTTAIDKDALAKPLAEAKAKDIPVVTCCSLGEAGKDFLFNIGSPDQGAIIGEVLAAKAVADSKGKADALYANISAFQILASVRDAFKAKYSELCPDCKFATIDIPLTALGKDAPDRIVSYLRSHPKVNYLVLSEASALGPGLTGALRAAGLGPEKVKIIGEAGNATTWQEIEQEKVEAVLPPALHSYDYGMLDALARHFAGVPVENTPPDVWLVDKENIPKTTEPAFSPSRLQGAVGQAVGQV